MHRAASRGPARAPQRALPAAGRAARARGVTAPARRRPAGELRGPGGALPGKIHCPSWHLNLKLWRQSSTCETERMHCDSLHTAAKLQQKSMVTKVAHPETLAGARACIL
jgi:hypothetical protein